MAFHIRLTVGNLSYAWLGHAIVCPQILLKVVHYVFKENKKVWDT